MLNKLVNSWGWWCEFWEEGRATSYRKTLSKCFPLWKPLNRTHRLEDEILGNQRENEKDLLLRRTHCWWKSVLVFPFNYGKLCFLLLQMKKLVSRRAYHNLTKEMRFWDWLMLLIPIVRNLSISQKLVNSLPKIFLSFVSCTCIFILLFKMFVL